MSIIESLKKLVDPARARQEEQERKGQREQPTREGEGGEPAPARFRCRVCRHAGPEPTFCPACLAATMRPIPRSEQPGPRGGDEPQS